MVHGVKTVNCAIKYDTRLQLNVKFRCHVWDGTPCRDKAVSLSLGLRYITNSICPILHAYLLQGYSVKAGHPPLLRSLVQIVTPSCWNVIIWWSLISFCKASQWNGMNMLQEIFESQRNEYVTRNMKTKSQTFDSIQRCIAVIWSMTLLNHYGIIRGTHANP